MVFHFLLCLTTLFVDLFASIRLAPDEKDLQIALLQQQLRVLERKVKKKPRLSRPEKLMLVALTTGLQRQTQRWQERLREAVLLVQPETVLKNWCVENGLFGDHATEDDQSWPTRSKR